MLSRGGRPAATAVSGRVWRRTLSAWPPVVLTVLYLAVLVSRYGSLVRRVYWDNDAAVFVVAAQTSHSTSVVLFAHYSSILSFWLALLTRGLPFHRELWEGAPTCVALAFVGLLALGSKLVGGRWAAVMTAVIGVAVAPIVVYDRITLNYHATAPLGAIALGVFALWLTRRPARGAVFAVTVVVSLLGGATLASDTLFLGVGVLPLMGVGLVALILLRRRFEGAVMLSTAVAVVLVASLLDHLQFGPRVIVDPAAPIHRVPLHELIPNVKRAFGAVAELANGSFGPGGWATPMLTVSYLLALLCTVLVISGVAAGPYLLVRSWRSEARDPALLVWAAFWSLCVLGDIASDIVTTEGENWALYYMVAVLYGVAATLPLVFRRTALGRVFAAVAISAVAVASITNLSNGAWPFNGLPKLAQLTPRLVVLARAEHTPLGFADYWDSSVLSWSVGLALQVAPVLQCDPGVLCPFGFNEVSSWYRPQPVGSFVLRDAGSFWMNSPPPRGLGKPERIVGLGDGFTVYFYRYDVASRFAGSGQPRAWQAALASG